MVAWTAHNLPTTMKGPPVIHYDDNEAAAYAQGVKDVLDHLDGVDEPNVLRPRTIRLSGLAPEIYFSRLSPPRPQFSWQRN